MSIEHDPTRITHRSPAVRRACRLLSGAAALGLAASAAAGPLPAAPIASQPYIVEWVYKVKWGHTDEFFDLFKKYQLKILDREKQLGDVLSYTIYRPGLHTGEDERWDYTVLIVYKNILAPAQASVVERQLFPDRRTLRRDENHRWELVESHWDLPLRVVDPHAPEE